MPGMGSMHAIITMLPGDPSCYGWTQNRISKVHRTLSGTYAGTDKQISTLEKQVTLF